MAWGPERSTLIRIPIARPAESVQPVPSFGPAGARSPPNWEERHDRLLRDLAGATASFDQRKQSRQILLDGTTISILEQTLSTVSRSRPEDTVLQSHFEADLDRPGDPLRAVVDTVQTQESFHIEASISWPADRSTSAPGTCSLMNSDNGVDRD